ncbi:MAG: TRAP transporter small permease, partial [Tissierellia bacterium]|nr:TRAP transporter small permease [Tissierellia bacterium]
MEKKPLDKFEEYLVAISLFIMTTIAFANVLS